MAHIPQGDIEELWNSAPHNWAGLRQNLEGRRGKAVGISHKLVDDLIQTAQQMEQKGEPFPSSDQQLYTVLNRHLPGERH